MEMDFGSFVQYSGCPNWQSFLVGERRSANRRNKEQKTQQFPANCPSRRKVDA